MPTHVLPTDSLIQLLAVACLVLWVYLVLYPLLAGFFESLEVVLGEDEDDGDDEDDAA